MCKMRQSYIFILYSSIIEPLSFKCKGLTVSVTKDTAYWLDMFNNYCPVAIEKSAEL